MTKEKERLSGFLADSLVVPLIFKTVWRIKSGPADLISFSTSSIFNPTSFLKLSVEERGPKL